MILSASITKSDVVKFYVLQLGSDFLAAKPWTGVLPIIAATAVGLFKGVENSDAGVGLLMGISVSVGVVALGILFMLLYVAMILSRLDENQPTGEVRFVIDERGVLIDTEIRHERFRMSDLTSSGSDDRYVWMQFSERHYRFIPASALPDKQLFASLRQSFSRIVGSLDGSHN